MPPKGSRGSLATMVLRKTAAALQSRRRGALLLGGVARPGGGGEAEGRVVGDLRWLR
jgi:hypothetical protein